MGVSREACVEAFVGARGVSSVRGRREACVKRAINPHANRSNKNPFKCNSGPGAVLRRLLEAPAARFECGPK